MPHGRLLAYALLVLATGMLGCRRDLGECNLDGTTPSGMVEGPAALDIAYRITDGLPMYEGQALVQSTCGDSAFCHAPAARGADRIGAPAGLDFDVSLVCTGPLTDCQADPPYDARVSRLEGQQSNIRNWAEGMMQEMREGAMPPGEAGRRVRNNTPWVRQNGDGLPSIESGDGQEIVRNWLACGAPAIGRTELAPSEEQQLQPCGSSDEEVICIYSGPSEFPDPNWRDIYWTVMFTQCVSCHGPANDNTDQNPDNPFPDGQIPGGASSVALTVLDLTGSNVNDTSLWPDESYDAVVGVSTSTSGPCAGLGLLVESGNPDDSIMIEKMYGTETCPPAGTAMPPTGLLPTPLVDVIAQWAENGAPLD